MDAFLLKKTVSLLIHLVPGVPIVMLFALLLIRWAPRLAVRCLWLCVVSLLLFSSPLVSNALVWSLEKRYPPLTELPADTGVVLVLGSGHQYRQGRSANSILSAISLSRMTEGLRLWQSKPETLLVTSGGGVYSESSNAESSAMFAKVSGVPEERLRQFDTALDTAEEISLAVELVNNETLGSGQRLVVVSSATHLRRAEQLLRNFDIEYALAPTDFIATDTPWYRLDSGHLRGADRALHEYVGMFWHWIKAPV